MRKNLSFLSSNGVLAAHLYYEGQSSQDLYIIMHGFMSSMNFKFLQQIRKLLESKCHAVLLFDFDGHGQSEGRFQDMTVQTELEDARAVYAVAATWPWVRRIHLIGHSQGGVVAGLLAGELGAEKVASLIQLAPAAVLHDDALEGHIMNAKFDPDTIPEYVRVFFVKKVGRSYFEMAQKLDIYGRSCSYDGPVCLIHGTEDNIVPYSYSEHYQSQYPNAELHLVKGENHIFSKQPQEALEYILNFIELQNYKSCARHV